MRWKICRASYLVEAQGQASNFQSLWHCPWVARATCCTRLPGSCARLRQSRSSRRQGPLRDDDTPRAREASGTESLVPSTDCALSPVAQGLSSWLESRCFSYTTVHISVGGRFCCGALGVGPRILQSESRATLGRVRSRLSDALGPPESRRLGSARGYGSCPVLLRSQYKALALYVRALHLRGESLQWWEQPPGRTLHLTLLPGRNADKGQLHTASPGFLGLSAPIGTVGSWHKLIPWLPLRVLYTLFPSLAPSQRYNKSLPCTDPKGRPEGLQSRGIKGHPD